MNGKKIALILIPIFTLACVEKMDLSSIDQTVNQSHEIKLDADLLLDSNDLSVQIPPQDMTLTVDQSPPELDQAFSHDLAIVEDAFHPVDSMLTPVVDMSLNLNDHGVRDMQVSSVDAMLNTPEIDCQLNIQINTPIHESFHAMDTPVIIQGKLETSTALSSDQYVIEFADPSGNTFVTSTVDLEGNFSASAVALHETTGKKEVLVRVLHPEGVCRERTQFEFYVCGGLIDEDFSVLPNNWTLFGDAYWDANGWLEMTGIASGQGGAVYNSIDNIASGLASIEFVMATGGGINGGADGFALTIVELSDPMTLIDLLNASSNGGGLGYAVSGAHAEDDFILQGEALTVEIDTWENTNRHVDPTSQNHIAITRNGDPGDHIAWFAVPNIEDLLPHTIRVDMLDGMMRISFDEAVVIEQEITFRFKGGYMFFSGSTGYATNYHRFDHLTILHSCQ